jgi:hypothetical protein
VDIMIAVVFFGVGLGLIIFFAEQLVKGVVGTSVGFGLSTFLLIVISVSVIFIGFDPDNLAVGTVASPMGLPAWRWALFSAAPWWPSPWPSASPPWSPR